MPREVWGQIISIIGMVLTILSFQLKTRKQIFFLQTAGTLFFLISFILLGSHTAAYLNVVFLFRNVIFYFAENKRWAHHPVCFALILIAVIGVGFYGFKSFWDIFAIIGSVFGTIAMYMKNENMLRILKLGDSPCWLVYNLFVPSLGGVICEVFNITSIIISIIRYKSNGFSKGREEKKR